MIKIKQIQGFESHVVNTSRAYTKGQGSVVVTLNSASGQLDYDLDLSNKFYHLTSENIELQPPTNDRGQSVEILVKSNGHTLTFHTSYRVLGDSPSTTVGEYILLTISCWGSADSPWVIVSNQPA